MNILSAVDILASGLGAQRTRMNVTASNLANAKTTRTEEGGPYKRRDPVLAARDISSDPFAGDLDQALRGVEVVDVVTSDSPGKRVYDPSHPDSDTDGYVTYPDINMVEEMVNMLTASRSYEAGLTAMRALIDMAERTLTLGK